MLASDEVLTIDAERDLALFEAALEAGKEDMQGREYLTRWLFADLLSARQERGEMNFYGFDGPEHVWKFFCWIMRTRFNDYFDPDQLNTLAELSAKRDEAAFARLGAARPYDGLLNVGRYNAQDFLFQRAYPVPERHKVRRQLDFGGGHGRSANLAFGADQSDVEFLTVVDAIPGPYLSQRTYFQALGLSMYDTIDHTRESLDASKIAQDHQILHMPTWRMNELPDDFYDMVSVVQVLKELPRQVCLYAIEEFARVLKPGGALYVRDHPQFHNPNHLPIDQLLQAAGFVLEFAPHIHDRVEVHGIPRIWRKMDTNMYLQHNEL